MIALLVIVIILLLCPGIILFPLVAIGLFITWIIAKLREFFNPKNL